ncbi:MULTISPECIES: GH32 C-terminal domain-containing protein [Subtercola]|uniref:beta-fructofuranosidase n=1 Tax=Subtercola vilae TaxID=2056433 RepID=A0A4T2C9M4_9MICO|nr:MULTISPECIES: GH32 C-terminal domain-containing protein [Subtercola]MEA9984309.1 GH32 C-terminal domain-containing protein [Subtercola sp. RTI3]TIH40121.1 glycoside hydrolase [Subtercola vilae]
MPQHIFFQPEGAWVGDVIPFAENGEFRLFYLHEQRACPKPGTPWHLVSTKDLVAFEDEGLAFDHGSADDVDYNVYTGSIVRGRDGEHHMFYTGQNPNRLGIDGLPLQVVMHATSSDGAETWVRHPEHTFGAAEGYESADWRDPFVFWDAQAELWRMLIAARHVEGPSRRRGVIAQCVSTDLARWTSVEPFWDPRRYIAHECPEVFQWGDWWYLVYSEFSDSFVTRYRMSKTLDGPWIAPAHDSLDGRAFYAAKSAERDGRRFFFGWIASRVDGHDDGAWQWAGTLAVTEASQRPDGTLAFSFASELRRHFTETVPMEFVNGEIENRTLDAGDGYLTALSSTEIPSRFFASFSFDIAADTAECGLLLRASADGDRAYAVRLEPRRGRMVFDRWPRKVTGEGQWEVSGDVPYVIELERACDLQPGRHTLEVVVDGDLCVANLDRSTMLSTRLYDHIDGTIGVFVGDGSIDVHELTVSTASDSSAVADSAPGSVSSESLLIPS